MEIIQKMKGAVAELKYVMKHENATGLQHFEVCFDDGIDPRYDSELDEESCDRTVDAALSQKETLKAQGLTLVTMSKEDWFWHLENVGPHLITNLKMRIFRYYYDLMEVKITRDDCMRNDDMEFDYTRRQFKSLAKEIAIKSCCCLFLACDYGHCFGEGDFDYNLPLFIQYVAIVLVIELIIESCNHCDSIEGMRKWVVEEVDAWCDKYFMEYKEYLLGAKRKRAAGLYAEDGLDANDRCKLPSCVKK